MLKRLTKIICTLGPACCSPDQLQALAETGMNIARINLSHGSREEHAQSVADIRSLNEQRPVPIGIMLDTRGAEIRTHDLKTPLEVAKGDTVRFLPLGREPQPDQAELMVNYDSFAEDVRETNCILIDNGELSFDIQTIETDGSVIAVAKQGGSIGSRRHINLPGAYVDLPSITPRDWEDIAFGVEQDVDFIALSFIRTADEVQSVREFLQQHSSSVRLITKIETQPAVDNLSEIIAASDGIMVARGDLGAEVPFDQLPVIQDQIVAQCQDHGIPVIVATHMLESMKQHPIPTRAELTDVAHAALTKADATMLSGETASGKHPTLALSAMHRILATTEAYSFRFAGTHRAPVHNDGEAEAEAAVTLASSSDADAIVVFTRTGRTARLVSKFRPDIPVIACCETSSLQGKITLHYGVSPLILPFTDPEDTVQRALEMAKKSTLIQDGQKVVLLSDTQAKDAVISTVQMREV